MTHEILGSMMVNTPILLGISVANNPKFMGFSAAHAPNPLGIAANCQAYMIAIQQIDPPLACDLPSRNAHKRWEFKNADDSDSAIN